MEPREVEIEYKCKKCGKLIYHYLTGRGAYIFADAIGRYKQWSYDTVFKKDEKEI